MHLLERVVDSFDKLDIVLFLYGVRFSSRSTATLASRLSISVHRVRTATKELAAAGIVRTMDGDALGWWFNPYSPWAPHVDALVDLYERSKPEVIELVASRARAAERNTSYRSPS